MIDADTAPPTEGAGTDEQLFDGDPIPLTQTVPIPPFPIDSLPKPIADMVRAVSESTQTDPAMPGTCALSVLSACTGGHAEIEIRGGWLEPCHLYTATIAAPGERKSAVQLALVRPLLDAEQQLAEAGLAARLEAETRRQVADRAAEKAKQDAAKAGPDQWDKAMADALGAAALAAAIEVPPVPRLIADDITPEAAATVLAEQGRLAIISAEGGIFDIIAGRYSGNVPNMDVWLKGHAGDPMKVDRKGRPPEYVRRPAVTLGLMLQPAVLNAVAANRQFRGRGLLARILYAYPVSKVGRRAIAPVPPDQTIVADYREVMEKLAAGMAAWAGDPAKLTLTPAAHEAMLMIETAVEPTLAGDEGELAPLADWGAKYVGAIARIAGLLHLGQHGPAGARESVQATTIEAAWRIGKYFRACAINAFAEMGADESTADAVYLLGRIARKCVEELSERDMHVASQSRFKTKADMLPALQRLVDHGYLAPLPAARPTGGRPASPRYRIHPQVL
ncbi:MAG TPA: YfjI family protein [Mycobacterium sp.]|nr:YfjI family protein [Mycobacterium sp.]HTX95101.1 YfjI family protein [Mycobacterium sp.]